MKIDSSFTARLLLPIKICNNLVEILHITLRTFKVILDVRRKSTLVTNITGVLSIFRLNNCFEVMVGLCSHFHRLRKTAGSCVKLV